MKIPAYKFNLQTNWKQCDENHSKYNLAANGYTEKCIDTTYQWFQYTLMITDTVHIWPGSYTGDLQHVVQYQVTKNGCHGKRISRILGKMALLKKRDVDLHIHTTFINLWSIM